jgi:hypothetical protein
LLEHCSPWRPLTPSRPEAKTAAAFTQMPRRFE